MHILYIGIFAVALVIGYLTGVSNTPVVGTIAPLIFSLITAGGVVYVVFGKEKDELNESDSENSNDNNISDVNTAKKAKLLGLQLLIFSIGFLPGVYAGVWSKFHPESVWFVEENEYKAAFIDIELSDLRLAHVFMDLDYKYYENGISLANRKILLGSLDKAIKERMTSGSIPGLSFVSPETGIKSLLSEQDVEALEALLRAKKIAASLTSRSKVPIANLNERTSPFKDEPKQDNRL